MPSFTLSPKRDTRGKTNKQPGIAKPLLTDGERYVKHHGFYWGEGEAGLSGEFGGVLPMEVGEAGGVAEFPLVGQPGVEVALWPSGEVHQQLREVKLRIDVVPAARGSQAGQNRRAAAAALVANK